MPDLRFPSITGRTEKEQIEEIKRYLFYLVEFLQFALQTIKTQPNTQINKNDKEVQ